MTHLETKNLILRPFTLEDVETFSKICATPDVMRYIGDGSILSKEQTEAAIKRWIQMYHDNGYSLLAVVLKSSHTLIGFCGLINQEVDGKKYIELGYRFDKAHWGKGYATEAAKTIKEHAFKTLAIKELISIIQPANHASIAVAQKLGMSTLKACNFHGQQVVIYYLENQELPVANRVCDSDPASSVSQS